MKKSKVAFCPCDDGNLKYFEMMKNSLRKFHSEEDLPLKRFDNLDNNPVFWYRATPLIAKDLLRDYEVVLKLDADQIITGDLSHIWEGDFDVATVNNSNPREMKVYPVSVWDIHPLAYQNCGFVVMKSESFVNHWWKLCLSPHFQSYQMREQDLLNIIIFYGDYKVKRLDESNKWHGLVWKQYEPQVKLIDNKLILPKNNEWPQNEDKELVCWHVAGGNQPNKMNYRIRFQPDVVKFIDNLVKP